MAESSYDLVVIGAGPGGYVAAIRAAQLGMRVACVDKDASLGGTCLNVGCIPSKALLHSSELYAQARRGLDVHGINLRGVELDLATMMERKQTVVRAGAKGVAGLFRKNKVESVTGLARIVAEHSVEVCDPDGETTRELRGEFILIATGSAPAELEALPFNGTTIVSSTEALSLDEAPSRLLVVGAGAVGLELGSVWNRLGSEVIVVEMLDQIVPGADREAAAALQRALTKQGLTLRLQTTAVEAVESGAGTDEGLTVTLASGQEKTDETFEVVLVAIGRRPYTRGLGLEEVGVEIDERGRVRVDEHYRTSIASIRAIGDVIPGPMLAHKAEEEGVVAVERMAGQAGHVNYEAIPSIVYTYPELASVGISEEAAIKSGIDVRVGRYPFLATPRARCNGETDGLVRIIADAVSDRILGVHIVGAGASEMIAEAAVAMEFRASAEDIARSSHAHPTLAEAMKEAALGVAGRSLNI